MQAIDVQTVVFHEGKHDVAQCLDVDVEDAPADAVAKVEGPEVRRLTLERA